MPERERFVEVGGKGGKAVGSIFHVWNCKNPEPLIIEALLALNSGACFRLPIFLLPGGLVPAQ